MFASLTAQKLSHDIDAHAAFMRSDVPEGVDVNLFQDAKRVILDRIGKRALAAQKHSKEHLINLFNSAERCSRDRAELNVTKAQKRRAAREEREAALAQA